MLTTLDITTQNLEKHMGHLGRVFAKANWNFTETYLYANLNWAYNRENYYFDFSENFPFKTKTLYKYIHSAGITGGRDPCILLYINKGSADFFRRFSKPHKTHQFYQLQRNQFFREMFYTITHEHIHEFQLINRNRIDTTEKEGAEYLGNTLEQSAFAQQAAIELIHTGHSAVIDSYFAVFGSESRIFKKWYSRVIRYLINFKDGEVEFLRPFEDDK